MARRRVEDSRRVESTRRVYKSIRSSNGKLLPRGFEFVERENILYIKNLKTEQETKFL